MQRGLGQPKGNPMNTLQIIRRAILREKAIQKARKVNLTYRGNSYQKAIF